MGCNVPSIVTLPSPRYLHTLHVCGVWGDGDRVPDAFTALLESLSVKYGPTVAREYERKTRKDAETLGDALRDHVAARDHFVIINQERLDDIHNDAKFTPTEPPPKKQRVEPTIKYVYLDAKGGKGKGDKKGKGDTTITTIPPGDKGNKKGKGKGKGKDPANAAPPAEAANAAEAEG